MSKQTIDYDFLIFLAACFGGGYLAAVGGVGTYLALFTFACLSIYLFTHNDEPED